MPSNIHSVEHHGSVLVHQNSGLKVRPERPGKRDSLQILPFPHHVLHRVSVGHGGDVLHDDRPHVQFRGGVMRGSAY
jgi:hypothetical protein